LAFQGLGISRLEMAAPVLVVALLISLFDFGFSETVVPITTRQARHIYTVQIKKGVEKGVFAFRRLWLRSRDGFLSVDRYDGRQRDGSWAAPLFAGRPPPRLYGITFFPLAPDHNLVDVHKAESATWDGRLWRPSNAHLLRIGDDGSVNALTEGSFPIDFRPAD